MTSSFTMAVLGLEEERFFFHGPLDARARPSVMTISTWQRVVSIVPQCMADQHNNRVAANALHIRPFSVAEIVCSIAIELMFRTDFGVEYETHQDFVPERILS